jgi:hypothetical protein
MGTIIYIIIYVKILLYMFIRLVVYHIFSKLFFGMKSMKNAVSVCLMMVVFYLSFLKKILYIGNI